MYKDIEYKWTSFTAGNGITFDSVCHLARTNGADLAAIARKHGGNSIKQKSYNDLIAEVRELNNDSKNEEIEAIVQEAKLCSTIEVARIHDHIKKNTGLPLNILRKIEKEGNDQSCNLDDLKLARQLVYRIGKGNVFSMGPFVWEWYKAGVWKKREDRSVKQWVQLYIGGDNKNKDVWKSRVESIADLFKTEIFRPDQEFDVGPAECVNCINGELVFDNEFKNWKLLPHKREHYRTAQIPVEYDPIAKAPRFERFLKELFRDDVDADYKIKALLEMIGYSLMAHCRHEKFIILVGNGANGKSVLLAILEALCGPSSVAGVQPSQFDRSFQRAHLHGKLANIVTEIRQGEVIDDASLKGIVSGEPTTVEHKFKDPFVMRPFATCWFGTNHLPHTRDFSDALFRRALIIEFNQTFKPELENCDPQLKDKLMEELPGILNISIEAYSNAVQKGFTMPASCHTARKNWRQEADQVAQFVADECDHGFFEEMLKTKVLFEKYNEWAVENGIQKRLGMKAFRDRLTRLGFKAHRTSSVRCVAGIKWKNRD